MKSQWFLKQAVFIPTFDKSYSKYYFSDLVASSSLQSLLIIKL